jgi:hypothetical protein
MINQAVGFADLASRKGLWGAAQFVGRGMAKPFMPWTWSDDPREFGRNFGGTLIAAAAAGAGGAEAGASGVSTPRPFMDALRGIVDNERGSISMRGLWEVTEEGTSATVRHPTFGKIYQSAGDGTWWSRDLAAIRFK